MADNRLHPPKPLEVSSQTPDTWDNWLQSNNWYAMAVQIHKKMPEAQVANLMTIIGPEFQGIFKTFLLTNEEKKDVEAIKEKFREYFTPKTNLAYERYKFNKVKQEDESVNEFQIVSRLDTKKCQFGTLTYELLRDRTILGISNNYVREKLHGDPSINLKKMIPVCKAKQATQELKEITTKETETKTLDAIVAKTKEKQP